MTCDKNQVKLLVYLPHFLATQVFPTLLPSSLALQKLHDLDGSLSKFYNRLSNVLYEEYTRCVTNLEGDDLVWLVDYLDKVHFCIAPP